MTRPDMTRPTCPTPDKRAYRGRAEARAAIHRHGPRLTAYLCNGCHWWHLTNPEKR
jgi:hypothetical protein